MMVNRIYLDFASSTPVDPRVVRAMKPYWGEDFGNPGSLHHFGQKAMAVVDEAREAVAGTLGAGFRDVVFTSGATEANNLAIQGAVRKAREAGIDKPKIIISAVEHDSVYLVAKALAKKGEAELVVLPVDSEGMVALGDLKEALDEATAVVSVIYVQNETGALQPIKEIAKIVASFRGENAFPLFHTDAAQAFQYFPCLVDELGIDLMTISGHKMYGPKGVGALYIKSHKQGAPIEPITFGGGQELGLRPGTENVPLIMGFAEASRIATAERATKTRHVLEMYEYLINSMDRSGMNFKVNGPKKIEKRSPHILNLRLPGMLAEEIITKLDLDGVAVSAGSACGARAMKPSRVLIAMGLSKEGASESLRISFGHGTREDHIRSIVSLFSSF